MNKDEKLKLRQKAEELKAKKPSQSAKDISIADAQKLIHELEVHQIELELQNEELILAKEQAAISSDKYIDLYDFAPSGYLTLSKEGRIVELNLSMANMLGKDRKSIANRLFGLFVSDDSKPIFNQFLEKVFAGKTKESCELSLSANANSLMYVFISGIVSANGEECLITAVDITERKQMEEKIKKTTQHYQALIEKASDGLVLINGQGDFKYVSPTARKMFEYGLLEEIPGNPSQYTHPEDLPMVLSHLTKVLRDPSYIPTISYRFSNKSGNWIWVESTFTNLLTDPNVESVVINFKDISDRKHAEKALKESEIQYRNLANSGSALVWTSGIDKLCNYFNEPWLQFTGRTLEQEIGNGWAEGVHPDDFDRCLKTYITAFDKHEPFEMEYRLRHSSGEYRWILDLGTPNFNHSEEFVGYIGHCFDITERKQIEEELIRSENELKKAQQITHIGSWYLDVATNKVVWTEELYKMYGFDPSLPPPPYTEHQKLFTPESWELLSSSLAYTADTGNPYELELKTVKGDGSNGWMWVRGETIKDKEGKTIGLWGAAQDITIRKEMAEEIIKRENLLNKVFDLLPIGLWFADANGRLIRGNPAGVKIWGAEPTVSIEEYGVFKARHLPSGKEIESDDWALAHTIKEGVTIVDELLEIDAFDGQKKIVLNYTAPIIDKYGKIQGAIVVNHDITERKRAEEALRLSEERYRSLFNNLEAGIVVHAPDTSIIMNNDRASELLSLTNDQMKGKTAIDPAWKFVKEDNSPLPLTDYPVNRLTNSRKPIKNQILGIFHSGKNDIVWLTVNGFPMQNSIGKISEYIISFIDISERKQAEEAIKDKVRELEQFNKLMVGREVKMVELKKEINELLIKIGEKEKYKLI